MKIIIRDDDLNFFSPVNKIEEIYKDIWEKHPIHFAAIPMVYARQKEIPHYIRAEKDYYDISKNKELVGFLKKKISENKIVIWQHGYTHRDNLGKFELENNDEKKIAEDLRKGKNMLETAFGVKIDTLVAPHDRFSKTAVIAAEKVGYAYLCRGYSPLPREFQARKEYICNFTELLRFFIRNGTSYRYPKEMDFGRHKEIYFYRIEDFFEDNIGKIIKFIKNNEGMLCITCHHLCMGDRLRQMLVKIIMEAEK